MKNSIVMFFAIAGVGVSASVAAAENAPEPAIPRMGWQEIQVKAPFPMAPLKVPVFPAREFAITEFGAQEGGTVKNTAAIAIKSGSNHDGWRLGTPTANVVIKGCTVRNGHQLTAIGSELSGGIRNVYIHEEGVRITSFAEEKKPVK